MFVFSILTCSWSLSNCLRCSLMCSSCMAHSAFSFDRRSWRLRNSSSSWLCWNLANVAGPEPKGAENRKVAATGFGQENVAPRHGRSDRVDPDALLLRILALQFVHFRLVRIGTDQVNTPIVGFFTAQNFWSEMALAWNENNSQIIKYLKLKRDDDDVLCCLVWRNGISCSILAGRRRHQIGRRPSPIGLPLAWFR